MGALGHSVAGIFGGLEAAKGARGAGVAFGRESRRAEQSLISDTTSAIQELARRSRGVQAGLGGLMQSPLAQLLFEEAQTRGLSPAAQLQLETSEEAINRALASRGLFRSGPGIEAQAKSAERISAADTLRKFQQRRDLLGYQTGLQQNIEQLRTGLAGGIANLYAQRGANLANLFTGRGEALAQARLGEAQGLGQAYLTGGKTLDVGAKIAAILSGNPAAILATSGPEFIDPALKSGIIK